MGIKNKKVPTNLFTVVFGIVCLMITGVVGYVFTQEVPTLAMVSVMIASVFTMWMVFVSTFTNLVMMDKIVE